MYIYVCYVFSLFPRLIFLCYHKTEVGIFVERLFVYVLYYIIKKSK